MLPARIATITTLATAVAVYGGSGLLTSGRVSEGSERSTDTGSAVEAGNVVAKDVEVPTRQRPTTVSQVFAERSVVRSVPTIVCPPDVTLECDQATSPSRTGMAAASTKGERDAETRISFEDVREPGSCGSESVISRLWTAANGSGKSSVCLQTIRVVDSQGPRVVVPANVSVDRAQIQDLALTGSGGITDNCDPHPRVGFTDSTAPGSSPDEWITTRLWTAVDTCGNVTVVPQTITASDLTSLQGSLAQGPR